MTPNVYRAWRAQSPRFDFAERTVAAIVCDRIESRRGARPRRWMSAFAVACVLVIVGALAWAALPRTAANAAVVPDVAAPAEGLRTTPPLWRAPAVPEPTAVAVPPPVPAVKAARHKEPAAADKSRHVNVPRCGCDPMICDCVEPQ